MEWEEHLFGNTRKQAFSLWETSTNRNCNGVNDDITGSFECKWQDRATLDMRYSHISIFCSLGEWANNISDILQQDSCDYYNYLDEDHCQALFRYYTRLLLVISEILTDFEKIIIEVKVSIDTQKAREFFSAKQGEIHALFAFINKICKHKTSDLHRCNHHLPIWFEDCKEPHSFRNLISISNLDFNHPDGILVPKLNYFINVVIQCYARLDELFVKETDKIKIICDKYNGISYGV